MTLVTSHVAVATLAVQKYLLKETKSELHDHRLLMQTPPTPHSVMDVDVLLD